MTLKKKGAWFSESPDRNSDKSVPYYMCMQKLQNQNTYRNSENNVHAEIPKKSFRNFEKTQHM